MSSTKMVVTAPAESERGTFTCIELAKFLSVSRSTIWRMHAKGKLPRPVRFNRAVRWDRWTIMEWLADGAPSRQQWEQRQAR